MKLIFIDRDGVINKDPGGWTEHSYVTRWKDFHFLPGAKESLARLTKAKYEIIIISNQAGVNKGHFSIDDLELINSNMMKSIKEAGGRIRSVHYCPHRTDEKCGCKKPDIGLFKKATKGMVVDYGRTYFIGDGSMDVEAGRKIGCRTILVLSGKSTEGDVDGWKHKPDHIMNDLKEAVDWILENERRRR